MLNLNLKLGKGQYAILERDGLVDYYQGKIHQLTSLDELRELQEQSEKPVVFLNPFRSAREKGFEAHGDEPVLALETTSHLTGTREQIAEFLDSESFTYHHEGPDVPDDVFEDQVAQIKADEIDGGNVNQVIVSRRFNGKIDEVNSAKIHEVYKNLLQQRGQYMTFLFGMEPTEGMDDDQITKPHHFVGATPEQHIKVKNGQVQMNPIAGTMKKADRETFEKRLEEFALDEKEIDELFMVIDETIKLMARICPEGGSIEGPFLREAGAVIHTEYRLVGHNGIDALDALKQSMHAPTLVGGPEDPAMKIIFDYEPKSRRYYGSQIGELKKDEEGHDELDSGIMIRFAEIDGEGNTRIQAGAGIVDGSVPKSEQEETRAKAEGMKKALEGTVPEGGFLTEELRDRVQPVFDKRNNGISDYHMRDQAERLPQVEKLKGKKLTILNNRDDFAYVIGHMAVHMGCDVSVIDALKYDPAKDDSDILIIGPGPGDINDVNDPRMQKLVEIAASRSGSQPTLGICLGHQAISKALGFAVERQSEITQGVQREIDLYGQKEKVGFYNSFSPLSPDQLPDDFEQSVDQDGRLVALRGKSVEGVQFHPESIRSENGYHILRSLLLNLAD